MIYHQVRNAATTAGCGNNGGLRLGGVMAERRMQLLEAVNHYCLMTQGRKEEQGNAQTTLPNVVTKRSSSIHRRQYTVSQLKSISQMMSVG